MYDHWPKDLYNASGFTTGIAAPATTGKASSRPAIGETRAAAMDRPDFKQRPGEDYRQLRVITVLASLLGMCLLLPHGIVSERALPAIGIAPMFCSAVSGILTFTGMLKSPRTKAWMDLILAASLFSIMIPGCVASISWSERIEILIWLSLTHSFVALHYNGWYQGAGLVMLGTFGSSTMILNLYANAPFLSPSEFFLIILHDSTIHSYLAAISMDQIEFPRLVIAWRSSPCAHCNHDHHHVSLPGGPLGLGGAGLGLPHEHGVHGVHQPFIDSSDDAARDSSDYQTSGFGSPRRSAETLATDANDLERRAGSFEC